ncbi:MAG: glycosyltransferase family 2 protein [Agathobacter sp.]
MTSDIKHITLSHPRLSIIIPLYNKAPYVKKALESVMSQTYRDFELIIVDDGSTDNSASICEEYLSRLSTLDSRLIRQANSGVAAARNNGVAASHGEFLCFLDADDWWKPTFLEEMDKLISAYPDAGLYATNYIYYKPGKTHVALKLSKGYINYPKAYLESIAMPVCTGAACMPRRVFDEMGGFPVGIKLGEDFLLWAKTALHYKVAFCEKPLAYYNNDVPAPLRATRNLHAPEYHMLFLLGPLEAEIAKLQDSSIKDDWKRLLDTLRVGGLMDYWLSDEYHDIAASELAKIDWSRQPRSAKAQYEKPIWFLKAKRRFMQIGSYWKQKLILYLWK